MTQTHQTPEDRLRKQSITAGFAALAICIHLFESTLPSIMGIKPGLANVITLIVLLRHGLRMAIHVQLLRVFIASLLNGSIFTPTFFLSLTGSLCALLSLSVMYVLVHLFSFNNLEKTSLGKPSWGPGPVSYSVFAALFHMLGQFMLAYYWLIPQTGLFKVLPFLLLIALAFGWVNGIMSSLVLNKLEHSTPNGHHA